MNSFTLKNCTFTYFLADYEALINVENNNIVPMEVDPTSMLPKYYSVLGSDKGVNLQINKTKFRHSRFCKGMLVSKARTDLGLFSTSKLLILDHETQVNRLDLLHEPMINITESEFTNLNMGHAVKYLSLQGVGNLPVNNFADLMYPGFDNHGSVLNLQGFSGKVEMFDSEVKLNFVFIPDMFPSKRFAYAEEDRLEYYYNKDYSQFKTTRCNYQGNVTRLFSNYLTSVNEHPDEVIS